MLAVKILVTVGKRVPQCDRTGQDSWPNRSQGRSLIPSDFPQSSRILLCSALQRFPLLPVRQARVQVASRAFYEITSLFLKWVVASFPIGFGRLCVARIGQRQGHEQSKHLSIFYNADSHLAPWLRRQGPSIILRSPIY